MMTMVSNTFPERLYLSKDGAADIYVDDCQNLRRNQIHSLRGLYGLFKKKVPGAILNNASDSGKTVTVVLFIEAVQKLLSDPVLILCNHNHEIQYWNEMLLKWTKYTEDNIALESTNPYLKKSIFIQISTELANSFFRRNWSVLVLKDDEIRKEVSKMVFNAQFKIWITTVDVFRDLEMLSSVGKFINPKMNVNIEDFEIKDKNVIEKIKTVVLLQAFAEDFVVRTDDLKSILQKPKESNKNIPSPITRKNKDTTGTKIKKSKRKLSEDTRSTIESSKLNKKASIENNTNEIKSNKENIVTNDDDDQDSPSVLNLKRRVSKNNTQIEISVTNCNTENDGGNSYNSNENSEFFDDDKCDATNVDSTTCSQPLSDHSTQCLTDEIENEENNLCTETSQVNLIYSEDVEMEVRNEVNTSQNLTDNIAYDIEENTIKDFNETEADIFDTDTVDLNTERLQLKLDHIEDVEIEINNDRNIEKNIVQDIHKTETEVFEKDTVDIDTGSLQIKSDKIEDVEIEKNRDRNSEHNVQETETNNSIIEQINTKIENVEEQSFDQKMSKLEAQTLLKFKGSILDSIF